MQQNIRKPGRESDLNPCLLPNASQLGIPSEFAQDPSQTAYPPLVEGDSQVTTFLDDIELYDHMGGSNVGSFVADTIRSLTTPIHSINPSYSSFHSRFLQPSQRITHSTPYPPELGPIRNVCAFGPLRCIEEERGQLMHSGVIQVTQYLHYCARLLTTFQAVSDVAITGMSRRRPLRNRLSAPYQNPSAGQISQVRPIGDQTTTAQEAVTYPTVDNDTKAHIILEAKHRFRYQFFAKSPFPTQEASNDYSRTSLRDAMNIILGGNLCSICCLEFSLIR